MYIHTKYSTYMYISQHSTYACSLTLPCTQLFSVFLCGGGTTKTNGKQLSGNARLYICKPIKCYNSNHFMKKEMENIEQFYIYSYSFLFMHEF